MVMNHLKNSRSRIWIRIFTKIETILPCHTPNLSTKFHPNPSTTFWDIMIYIIFGPISQWWRITEKIIRSRSSPRLNQFLLVTHPTCPPSFAWICPQPFEISCYISFLARSLNGEESLKKFWKSYPDPDLHQNLISLSMSQTEHVQKISSGSIHNFLRYSVHRQTERGEKITSFTFGGGGK